MPQNAARLAHASALVLLSLLGLTTGCFPGSGPNLPGEKGLEVGGPAGATWRVTFKDPITVKVKGSAGVVSSADLPMASGSFKVGEATIQLPSLCSRNDVVCPQDVFPLDVTLVQPGEDLHMLKVTVNPKGPLALLPQPTLLGNVDSLDGFSVILGVDLAGAGTCGMLGISLAKGRIMADPKDYTRGIGLNGTILVSYAGACVVIGNTMGATGAGLTVDLEVPFTAARR